MIMRPFKISRFQRELLLGIRSATKLKTLILCLLLTLFLCIFISMSIYLYIHEYLNLGETKNH